MNTPEISPNIKDGLRKEISRKAPAGLHARIMQQVRLLHNQSLVAPTVSGWVVAGIVLGALFIAYPFLGFVDISGTGLEQFNMPRVELPLYVWLSVFAAALLVAIDSLISSPVLKKA